MAPSASFFFSSFQGSSRKRFLIRWKNSGTDLGSFRNPGNRKTGSGGDSEMSGNRKWSLWNLTVSFPASKCRMNIDLHQLTPDHSTVSLKKQTTCQKNTNKSDQIWEIWEEIELWKALIRQKKTWYATETASKLCRKCHLPLSDTAWAASGHLFNN